MIEAIAALLICQLTGEALARNFSLPVPGPVIGLALLFVALRLRALVRPDATSVDATSLGAVCSFLLAHLSLLFVPAGTGIVRHAATLVAYGPGLVVALVVSTALTLTVTALVFNAVAKRSAQTTGSDDS